MLSLKILLSVLKHYFYDRILSLAVISFNSTFAPERQLFTVLRIYSLPAPWHLNPKFLFLGTPLPVTPGYCLYCVCTQICLHHCARTLQKHMTNVIRRVHKFLSDVILRNINASPVILSVSRPHWPISRWLAEPGSREYLGFFDIASHPGRSLWELLSGCGGGRAVSAPLDLWMLWWCRKSRRRGNLEGKRKTRFATGSSPYDDFRPWKAANTWTISVSLNKMSLG
jgi:hypothetical protein